MSETTASDTWDGSNLYPDDYTPPTDEPTINKREALIELLVDNVLPLSLKIRNHYVAQLKIGTDFNTENTMLVLEYDKAINQIKDFIK